MLTRRLGEQRVAEDSKATARIVTACAGSPLALAIVSARAAANSSSLSVLADELADSRRRMDALSGEQASMEVRAVFSWSYGTLSDPAGTLMRELTVHPGPEISVESVATFAGRWARQVRRALAELVAGNLLAEVAPGRCAVHDLVRAHAAELLASAVHQGALRRLLEHYLHSTSAVYLTYGRAAVGDLEPAGELLQGRRSQITEASTTPAQRVDNRAAADPGASPALAHYALTILDLGHGRYAEALNRALEVFHVDPPELGTQILPDLIEAAVRSGNRDAAASALQRLSERTHSSGTRLASGLLARCQALLTDDAEALYRQAIEHLRQSDSGLQLARAHLLYGEWLRRRRRRRDAREQLRAAQELFDNLGFPAFAHRASVELHATSQAVRKRSGVAGDGLTPQEAEIARLVAEGLSNRQVAAQMFISHNTVEYHLQKVFRKIGVSSRTQLARAILEAPMRWPIDGSGKIGR